MCCPMCKHPESPELEEDCYPCGVINAERRRKEEEEKRRREAGGTRGRAHDDSTDTDDMEQELYS